MKTEACHVYDLEERYAPLMESLFGKGNYNLGPVDGDLTKTPLAQLAVPNFLISGPPCPPWAGNGLKQSQQDERACVFEAVVKWILHFARSDQFLGFAIENVSGMMKKIGGREAYTDIVLAELANSLKGILTIDLVTMVLTDYGLPHQRTRIFFRGVRTTLLQGQGMPAVLQPTALEHKSLAECLAPDLPHTPRDSLCLNKQKNLRNFEFQVKVAIKKGAIGKESIAVCSIDRSEAAIWQVKITYDKVPTLLTQNHCLFLLSTGDLDKPDADRKFFRFLDPYERMLLQGVHVQVAEKLNDSNLIVKAAGNCYPPVLVAAVVAPILALIPAEFVVKKGETYEPTRLVDNFKVRRPRKLPTAMKANAMKAKAMKPKAMKSKAKPAMKVMRKMKAKTRAR